MLPTETPPTTAASQTLTFAQALNLALLEEMEHDAAVLLLGEDIGAFGGVYGVTRGLQARFGPRRVRDTPISETGFLGAAVGAAMGGLRPVAEIMYVDFTMVALDPIINQAAKLRYISHGQVTVPLVFRTQQGTRPGTAAQHAQSFEAFFAHTPGLRVVAAATPADARGLLKSAIRSDDPVIFLEHKALYAVTGPVASTPALLPLDQAAIVRAGNDITAITYSAMLGRVLEAAEAVAASDGISVEVIDLRSLAPIDYATLIPSVQRTNRAIVIHEAGRTGGLGAEIASTLQERIFDHLDGPIRRLGAQDTPKPFSPGFDTTFVPDSTRISATFRTMMR